MALLDVYNKALGVAGARANLSSAGEQSREGELCNLFYEEARNEGMSVAYWGSLRATARLSLIEEFAADGVWADTGPAPGWQYAYATPANMLRPRYFADYAPFSVEYIGDRKTIQTGTDNPILVYTRIVEAPDLWEPVLQSLVVAILGLKLASAMKVDVTQLRSANINFERIYEMALPVNANADSAQMPDFLPDWLAARGPIVTTSAPVRFLYPSQVLTYAVN